MSFSRKRKQTLSVLLLSAMLLSACGSAAQDEEAYYSAPAVQMVVTPEPGETPAPTPEQAVEPSTLRISEVMAKNRATLRDEDGDFSDWIEIENTGSDAIALEGFRLTDKENRPGLALSGSIGPGELRLFWASGKDRADADHGDFSLSADETVSLLDPHGRVLSAVDCRSEHADCPVAVDANGDYAETDYATPGYPNTKAGYEAWQEAQGAPSPLQINEVCVFDPGDGEDWGRTESDWVEIKNVSDQTVELSAYCLSDDPDDLFLWQFPARQLAPGGLYLVRCDDLSVQLKTGDPCTGFSLDAGAEHLYLTKKDGTLVDWAAVHGVPFGGSFGRMEDEAGWFYFAASTPASKNSGGCRRVSAKPVTLSPDGVFNDVDSVRVELSAEGKIYYELGDDVPTVESEEYTVPLQLQSTGVVRAIAVEEGALPSRPAVFSYIINENHTLPVLSLVADHRPEFNWMYYGSNKRVEVPATLSLYEEDGSFTIPCGVKMHGETSLDLEKKNMSVRFRSAYGADWLNYDVYDGGVDRFGHLVLRAGQDYYATIIKNALCQNLCLMAGNRALTGRSKFCILYVNGEYFGIYNLMEKTNEQLYADLLGVSRESVEVIESPATKNDSVYNELFAYMKNTDLCDPVNYKHAQELVDIDNVIDWIILEGYCANTDLTYGNVRYARSTEGDGKWRLMFYDLDATFWESGRAFVNMFDGTALFSRQVGVNIVAPLLRNPDFRARLLERTSELFGSVLSGESVMAEIERLAAQVEPEVARDYADHGMFYDKWTFDMDYMCDKFQDDAWNKNCIEQICSMLHLTEQERETYFGA